MKMKLKPINNGITTTLVSILFFLTLSANVHAQNSQFSYTQYMDNLTPFNPAYSLLDKAASVNTLARRQWLGVDGSPTTFMANVNVPIESIDGAAGLIVMNDKFAIEHQTEVNAYFAKAIQLSPKNFLSVSLNAGIRNYVANYSSLDANDPVFASDVRETKPNLGFGVMFYTDWYYVGISVPELSITSLGTASIQDNNNFKNHYYFSGAFIANIDEDVAVKPATLVSYVQGVPMIADISGTVIFKQVIGLGINYRTNNEMAGIFTLNVSNFHIGYSYQFGLASDNLGGFNMPTHEITLGYRFGKGSDKPKLL
ncbi:PorP/SprF family type IX secretion system membrane protein [Mucilaginibacter sp. X5P1]|uniref:PorP/SprF family type IX secretion system membrane protein n=1 Tax=Mucilaginibacter sp. X5P1 TaxID=2723088 RepID=UPI001613CE48|nr:PorP/SprF family type IX secretion system membrane protein [Mucilaginibacter sp. X5P1]MBB6138230.1 type IX secretion system PorP/SprF family membrane protein [Mucilaginibacter sp. X5P1]